MVSDQPVWQAWCNGACTSATRLRSPSGSNVIHGHDGRIASTKFGVFRNQSSGVAVRTVQPAQQSVDIAVRIVQPAQQSIDIAVRTVQPTQQSLDIAVRTVQPAQQSVDIAKFHSCVRHDGVRMQYVVPFDCIAKAARTIALSRAKNAPTVASPVHSANWSKYANQIWRSCFF